MKSKICTLLLILSFSISLSACSADKTGSSAGSSAPGSSQAADASASDPSGSASSSEDEASSPTDAYKAVLQNKLGFISTDTHQEISLDDFLSRNSKYEGIYKVTHFAVLDMDGDQTPEVVLELSLGNDPEQYEILYDIKGTVYGCNFVYRGFEMLKADGTYRYASNATDIGIEKVLSFQADSVETEPLGYAQADYSGSTMDISYFLHNASVTKEDFDAFIDQQDEKKDVQWYAFSMENLEAKVRMDWNTDPLSEAADHQKSYYGEWVVQKVLAYGTGTYSRDDAEKLLGKSLSFSAEEANIFTDQPSDAAAVLNGPEYRETVESSSDFQADYRMSFDALGISADSVKEVQVTVPGGAGGVFLIKDSGTIILIAGGTYFELARQ